MDIKMTLIEVIANYQVFLRKQGRQKADMILDNLCEYDEYTKSLIKNSFNDVGFALDDEGDVFCTVIFKQHFTK